LVTFAAELNRRVPSASISVTRQALGIHPQRRWALPFVAVMVIGLALILVYPPIAKAGLARAMGDAETRFLALVGGQQ